MSHLPKLMELHRIPFAWRVRLLKFYLLRLIGTHDGKGENMLRFYIHLITSNGRLISDGPGFLISRYKFEGKDITVKLRNFPSSDPEAFEQIFVDHEYRRVTKLFGEGTRLRMIDAGANIGFASIYFSLFFPNIKVIAVEPDPKNFELLTENLKLNGVENNICLRAAVWKTDSYLEINNDFRDGKAWSVRVNETDKVTQLKGITLDGLLDRSGEEQIDLFKMDIEGSEGVVLENMGAAGIPGSIRCFAIEIHDEIVDRARIEGRLADLGYRISFSGELTIAVHEQR